PPPSGGEAAGHAARSAAVRGREVGASANFSDPTTRPYRPRKNLGSACRKATAFPGILATRGPPGAGRPPVAFLSVERRKVMRSLLFALAVAGACSPALADSVRLYAESPHNGSYLPNGTRWGSGGLSTSSDQVNGVRAITEFNVSNIPSAAGYAVVVHSARFEVRVVSISGVGADRLAFYAYEGDGVIEG